jgi:hypothetical protein
MKPKDDETEKEEDNDDDCSHLELSHKAFTCNACKFPFYFLHKLVEGVEAEHLQRLGRIGSENRHEDKLEDALSVIRDAHDKFYLFMAHKA